MRIGNSRAILKAMRPQRARALWEKAKSSAFVKNTLVIMTGSALAQVLGFALTPVISRLFTPSDFGRFGSFTALASVIAAGVTLEYGQAIMLPREKENAVNVLGLSFLCTGIVTLLCAVFCAVAPGVVNGAMKTAGFWPLMLLVGATLVAGINQSCQAWAVRAKAFKTTSVSQVVRSLTSNGAKIALGAVRSGAVGLMTSNVLADLMASVSLVRVLRPDSSAMRHEIRWGRMKKLAAAYRDFPFFSASQNIINALSIGLPVLLITRFYGVAEAGAYAFAGTVLMLPVSIVLTALRQVLFQKACETQHRGGNLSSLYVRMTAGLLAMILIPATVLFIWAPQLFSWVFGAKWHLAGVLARSLAVWIIFSFSNLPAVLFVKVIRIQRFAFLFDACLLAARLAVLILGGMYLSVVQTVTLFAVVGAGMNIILILRVGRYVMKKEGIDNLDAYRDSLSKEPPGLSGGEIPPGGRSPRN